MVFAPRPPIGLAQLGVTPALPRSVPSQVLVALLSRALTGQVVEKASLFGILALGVWGAARLVPARRAPSRVAAGLLYVWNPAVYERFLLGQWAFLLGYALLPWVASAALAFRRRAPRSGCALTLALAATVVPSPYTGVLGAALAAAIVLWPGDRARARTLPLAGMALAANLPWLVPAVLGPGIPERPAIAVLLFRARPDAPIGTLPSLLSLGGVWRADLAPPGRDTLAWLPVFLLLAGLAVAGFRTLRERWGARPLIGLAALSAAGVLLAAAPAIPLTRSAYTGLARTLPGGGYLWDSQKFAVPFALLFAVGFGMGVDRLIEGARDAKPAARRALAAVAILPVGLAPTLAWAAGGNLHTAEYPPSWSRADAAMSADPARGAVLVLPWHTYLPLRWNGERTVLDPAPVYFHRPVVTASSITIGPSELPNENPWSRLAEPVIRAAGPLRPDLGRLGVRYVLLLHEADWRRFRDRVNGLRTVVAASDLTLYRGPAPARLPSFDEPPAGAVIAGDVLWLVVLLAAVGCLLHRDAGIRRTRTAMLPP